VSRRPVGTRPPVTETKTQSRLFHACAARAAIVYLRRKPAVTWEIALSRIWEALKQAERQRSRANGRDAESSRAGGRGVTDSDRRNDLRHPHQATLLVYGSDVDKQPFHEETETLDANEEGCLLALETVVVRGQRLFLTNMRTQAELECRVVHVGQRIKGRTRVGVAFSSPAPDFWRRP
jgi:hypothetical protein